MQVRSSEMIVTHILLNIANRDHVIHSLSLSPSLSLSLSLSLFYLSCCYTVLQRETVYIPPR